MCVNEAMAVASPSGVNRLTKRLNIENFFAFSTIVVRWSTL